MSSEHPHSRDESPVPASRPAGERSSTSQTNIAFIVHSADTLTNNLPPNVDNKPLARQKRRRTRSATVSVPNTPRVCHANQMLSPEDQLILESEYRKNSKPDKAARMAIVERVALGEKEVQVSHVIPGPASIMD